MSLAVTQKHVVAATIADNNTADDTGNGMRKKLPLDNNVCADLIDIDAIKQFLGPAVQVINSSTPIFDDDNNSSTKKQEADVHEVNNSTLASGSNNNNNTTQEIKVNKVCAEKEKNYKLPSTMTYCAPYNKSHKQTKSSYNRKNDDSLSRIRHSTHPFMDDYEYKYTLHPSCFYNRDANTNDNDINSCNNKIIIDENNSVVYAMSKCNDCLYDEKIRAIKHNNYKRNYNNSKMLCNTAECCASDVNGILIGNNNMTTKIDKGTKRQYECNGAQEQPEKSSYTINSPLKPLSKAAISDMCNEHNSDKNNNIISGQCNTANSNRLESIYANNNNNIDDNSRCKEVITYHVPIKEYNHTDVINEMKDRNNETNYRNALHKEIGDLQCTKEFSSKANSVKNNNNASYFRPSYAAQSVLVNDASVVLRNHYFLPDDQIATKSAPSAISELLTSSETHQNKEHLSPAAKMLLSAILYIKALGGFSLLISAKPLENTEYAGYEDCIEMTFFHPMHDKFNEVSFCTTDISYANVNDASTTAPVQLSTFLNKAESTAQNAAFVNSKSSKGKRFTNNVSTKRSEDLNNDNSSNNSSKVMKIILRAVMSHRKHISMFGKTEIVHVLPALPFQTSLQRDDDNDDNMWKVYYTDIRTDDDDMLGTRAEAKNVTSTISKKLSERLQLSADDVLFKYAIDDTDVKHNASNTFINDNAIISQEHDDYTEVALRSAWNEFVTRHSTLYGKELIIAFLEGDMSFKYPNSLPEAAELEQMRYNIFSAAAPLLSEGAMNTTYCKLQSLSDESCYKTCTSENTSAYNKATIYTDTRNSFADDVQAIRKKTVVDAEQLAINNNKSNNYCNRNDINEYSYNNMPSRCSVKCYSDNIFEAGRWHDRTNLHSYSPITIAESTLQKHEKQVRKRGCKQKVSKKKAEHSVYDFRRMRLQRFYFELKITIDTILKCQLDLERQLTL